ncbi:MAG: zinc ABC transporter substrate-binding protein [Pseudomonadota bacterium]
MAHRVAAAAGLALVVAASWAGAGFAQSGPRVAASILPVHSLIAGVMEGVGAPALIVRGLGSPHTYALRPSEARALNEAELVFWIGAAYETFLDKPIKALSQRAKVVELLAAPGVVVLPVREGREKGTPDVHVWLDPDNARAVVRAAAAVLAKVDGGNGERYRANADRLIARLDALDQELRARLAPVQARPFVAFHDAYQYFEKRYGLTSVGSIAVHPDRPPGAKRLSELRKKIGALKAVCVFAEPQFESALVATVIEGTGARAGTLDPLGAGLAPGPEAYFAMLRNLAASFAGCLSHPP